MGMSFARPTDPNYLIARAYFQAYNPSKAPPKDIKKLTEWVVATPLKEQLDNHDKPPEVKEMQLGGLTWTVVSAKGDGIGVKNGWGTVERRFYMVMIDKNILWIDAFVRLGEDDEIKQALWHCIETIAITTSGKK